MTDNRNTGNYNDSQQYVVGILSPSTNFYIDQMPDSNEIAPPNDLNLRRRNTNSFQITSVTVQGSRKNDDFADDSADDLDESHTDDLSSDFLDSSRADNDGYHSEVDSNPIADDLSPCGPIIFTQLPSRDPNMNLSLGVTPTFTAIGPSVVAGGVTMMTSKSESPISAQVPIMNPLPDNWQRRFKVVKIVSSEPFRRGRWLCMDFKDPPNIEKDSRPDSNGTCTPPAIQITGCDSDDIQLDGVTPDMLNSGNFAQVYEIPINQTFNGNFVMGNHQQMYGIILPQTAHLQPVTLVQDMSLQTTIPMDKNFNNLVNSTSIFVEPVVPAVVDSPARFHQPATVRRVQTIVNNSSIPNSSPPTSISANNNYNASQAVLNHVVSCTGRDSPDILVRTSSDECRIISSSGNILQPVRVEDVEVENFESVSSVANDVSQSSGLPRRSPPSDFGSNGLCCSPPVQSRKLPPVKPLVFPPQTVAVSNVVPNVVAPPTAPTLAETNSSQTAPEKIPPEVGHEVDPSAGSTASTGGNTVAIDNKIEQAMDLVKSHLMFAVREEVEVLKEKITELLERISQLEHENDILRANASAETLKQLSNQSQKKNGGGNAGKPQTVATMPPST